MPPDGDGIEQNAVHDQREGSDTIPALPPPRPVPSTDPKLITQARTPPPLHVVPTNAPADLFKLPPTAALKLLSAGIESLVRVTGDIPPTPPPTSPPVPNMSGLQREKAAIVRSHSEKNLANLHQHNQGQNPTSQPEPKGQGQQGFFDTQQFQPVDGVRLRHPPTPPLPPTKPRPYIVIGENMQPLNLQHSAITRKFFSKAPPPISIEDYLQRIHRFCPMSTAVYLATSLYIFRLAVEERAIPVTSRNCHRLLLAGLRVAMKALEDLSYPHSKVAKVGGVSEVELARLEISFCFLAGFELVVDEEALRKHWEMLKQSTSSGSAAAIGVGGTIPNLNLDLRRKKNPD
ncbi:cyclin-domain-containing protein [Xylaria bambusicola]|uniref:cyclin-domain-containing protein n=1 Tax=Xylaria bambusicola TaxID=326684 RepID=UPI0020075951|nr:cyclin-domain-containing protein [Xylaria bambusicola]KAI0527970.1 cyclin-domain-containing protein [Xylaria bambusicola]